MLDFQMFLVFEESYSDSHCKTFLCRPKKCYSVDLNTGQVHYSIDVLLSSHEMVHAILKPEYKVQFGARSYLRT